MTDTPIYAVGDIHGFFDELTRVLTWIERDGGTDAEIVFLGDLVDRGPDSNAVIDLLSEGIAAGRNWTVLCGNHDDMFATFLETGATENAKILSHRPWTDPRLGGLTTLASYGVDPNLTGSALLDQARENVPYRHLDFIRNLPHYYKTQGFMFVHGGVRPGVAIDDQDPQDLMWIREGFLDYAGTYPWLLVHGHTALLQAEHMGNRVNLDSGAGYGRPLTAAVFEGSRVWTLSPMGRQPLLPLPNAYAAM